MVRFPDGHPVSGTVYAAAILTIMPATTRCMTSTATCSAPRLEEPALLFRTAGAVLIGIEAAGTGRPAGSGHRRPRLPSALTCAGRLSRRSGHDSAESQPDS
ncbi:hypothetical protein DMA10_25785 [Streptomyces sp. WAC 01420]|nr:hypothetical protein DLM49_08265 [Streptomyces sp. WAC 01438]RSM91975.1 hypothetical protein DMA10_25785 [Streptomyces sp. WAC 01420]